MSTNLKWCGDVDDKLLQVTSHDVMGHTDWKKHRLLFLFSSFSSFFFLVCLYFCVDILISSVIFCPQSSPSKKKNPFDMSFPPLKPHPTTPAGWKTCRDRTFRIWSISSSKDCPFNLGQKGEEIYPNHWRIYSTSYITNYIYIYMCLTIY